jgi:tetratricopeptide (TPR) repeat protein
MTAGAGLTLLTLGVLADGAGGAGLGTTLATMATSALSIGAGGAAGNAVWDLVGEGRSVVAERLRDPRKRLSNHDLHALVGRAIAVVVSASARDLKDNPAGQRFLKRIAKRFPAEWFSATPDPRYCELLDESIPLFFGRTDGKSPAAEALEPKLWEQLLGTIAGTEVDADEQAALEAVSVRLHKQFPRALFELAKEDFSPGETGSPHEGKAFGALLLSLINNIMGGIGELINGQAAAVNQNEAVLTELKALREKLGQRCAVIARLTPEDVAAIVNPLRAAINTQSSLLADALENLFERVSSLHDKADQILASLTLTWADVTLRPLRATRPAHWVPRQQLMRELAEKIITPREAGVRHAVAVHGNGGEGKSVLALGYALDALAGTLEPEHTYPGGVVVASVAEQSLQSALAASLADLPGDAKLTQRQRAQLVLGKLSLPPRSLLIIDNIADEAQWNSEEFQDCLPGSECRVIAITQGESLAGMPTVHVGALDVDTAINLLTRFRSDAAEPTNRSAIATINREVAGLALAIAAVGALMQINHEDVHESERKTWDEVARFMEAAPLDDLPDKNELVLGRTRYGTKTVAVINALWQRLPFAERLVLDFAALLPPHQIPTGWLEDLLAACVKEDAGILKVSLGFRRSGDPQTPAGVVTHLVKLDLLRTARDELESFPGETPASSRRAVLRSLHSLHAKGCRQRLTNLADRRAQLLAFIAKQCVEQANLMPNAGWHPEKQYLLEPLRRVAIALAGEGTWPAPVLIFRGTVYPTGILELYEERLELLNAMLAAVECGRIRPATKDLAGLYQSKGFALWALGRLEDAEQVLIKSLEVAQGAAHPEQPRLAVARGVLARVSVELGKYDEVALLQTLPLDTTVVMDLLQRSSEAEYYMDMAMAILDAALAQGRVSSLRRAREWAQNGVRLNEAASLETFQVEAFHDANHANYLVNFAYVLESFGDFSEARSQYARALDVWDVAAGKNRHLTIPIRVLSALLEITRGNLVSANDLLDECDSIMREPRGVSTALRLSVIETRAKCLAARGDPFQAANKIEEALPLIDSLPGARDTTAVRFHQERAVWLFDAGRSCAAIDAMKQTMEAAESFRKSRPQDTVDKWILEMRQALDSAGEPLAICEYADRQIGSLESLRRTASDSTGAESRPSVGGVIDFSEADSPSVASKATAVPAPCADLDDRVKKLFAAAEAVEADGNYPDAFKMFREAHALCVQALGGDYPSLERYHERMAATEREAAPPQEALTRAQQVLRVRREHYHDSSPMIVQALNGLIGILVDMGQLRDAHAHAAEGLRLATSYYGDNHWRLSDQRLSVARLLITLGYFADAGALVGDAETSLKAAAMLTPAWVSVLALNRAEICLEMEQNDEAWRHFAEHERLDRRNASDSVWVQSNRMAIKAKYLSARGDHHEAVELMIAAIGDLGMRQRTQGVATAVRRTNFARILRLAGECDGAMEQIETAMKIAVDIFGHEHPALAGILFERAELLLLQQRRVEALENFRSCLRLRSDGYGAEAPRTADVALRIKAVESEC